jgi:hypothetical protein
MDEAKRFLRYILPGLIFPVMVVISLLISDFNRTIEILGKTSDKGIIGTIGGVFLASGALGYIFSVIYWVLYWREFEPRYIYKIRINDMAIDHRPLLRGLNERGRIEVVNIFGERVNLDNISKKGAFVIFSQHWWTSRIKNEADKEKFDSIDRLSDIMHAIGASFIGICLSVIAWAFIYFGYPNSGLGIGFFSAIIVLISVIVSFRRNYWDINNSLQSLLNSLFANMLEKQFNGMHPRRRIRIYYEV